MSEIVRDGRGIRGPLRGDNDPRHGTPSGYVYWKCRCDRCRAGNRSRNLEAGYAKAYRARQKAQSGAPGGTDGRP